MPATKIKKWITAHWIEIAIFMLFTVANMSFLNRVPGLMGDEAHEGENVFRLLDTKALTFQGERSYIGPLIDYVRIPFFLVFGYSTLALRVPMLVVSLITFILALSVFKKLFGDRVALVSAVMVLFSPIYLGEQRMSWAITLNVFFATLLLWLLVRRHSGEYRNPGMHAMLVGLIAGLGVQNHIIFLPTAIAIGAIELIRVLPKPKQLLAWWPALIGFWAGFGTQAVMLITLKEDQGDPQAVAQVFWERLSAFPKLLPEILSSSSYIARYTGQELATWVAYVVTVLIILCILAALVLSPRRKATWTWLLGIIIHLAILLVMIDRFNLRYFVIFVLAAWLLAGVGLGEMIKRLGRSFLDHWVPLGAAIGLTIMSASLILIPFLRTGGSLNNFALGNRTDSAAALVDTRELLKCVRGIGPVTSENVHIFNRLHFLNHRYSDIEIKDPDTEIDEAQWVVNYRDAKHNAPGRCPDLKFFSVTAL